MLLKEATEVRRSIFGEDHPEYANGLISLADVHIALRDLSHAESLLRQVIEIRRRAFGNAHPVYATTLKPPWPGCSARKATSMAPSSHSPVHPARSHGRLSVKTTSTMRQNFWKPRLATPAPGRTKGSRRPVEAGPGNSPRAGWARTTRNTGRPSNASRACAKRATPPHPLTMHSK